MKKEDGYVVLKKNPNAKARLLCFHHAGGSALSLVPLVKNMPEDVEICLFELPGRGMMENKQFLSDYKEGKKYFMEKVEQCIDRPSIIFGHSLGGLFAYSLASSLSENKQKFLRKLVVSAARSPFTVICHATNPREPFTVRSFESVKDDIKRLGGMPMELLDDEELLQIAIEITGRDFHLIDTFPNTEIQCIDIPFELWLGEQDSTVDEEEIILWKKLSNNKFESILFSGGHFYINECEKATERLRELITQECQFDNNSAKLVINQ